MGSARENPTWRNLAARYGLAGLIRPAALREILDAVDRVVIRGEGWGPSDPLRGERRSVELIAARLHRQALRRQKRPPDPTRQRGRAWSVRTYRRAIAEGERLGLLRVHRRPGLPPLVSPSWWTHPADGSADGLPELVWSAAAARILSPVCPLSVLSLSAPPVRSESAPISRTPSGLQGPDPGQTGGTVYSVTENRVRDTVRGVEVGHRAPAPRLPLLRIPLPIQAPDLRETAEQTIREAAEHPSWSGIEALIRKALETSSPDNVVSELRRTFNLWQTGNVAKPKAYLRKQLQIPNTLDAPPREDRDTDRRDAETVSALVGLVSESWCIPPARTRPIENPYRSPAPETDPEQAWKRETREYQAQALRLCEGRADRGAEMLAARERRDSKALRELVARWSLEDREHPPRQAQRLHRATEDAPETLCAAI